MYDALATARIDHVGTKTPAHDEGSVGRDFASMLEELSLPELAWRPERLDEVDLVSVERRAARNGFEK